MIEQLLMRAGMIIFSRTVAGLGTIPYATHQACMNIQSLSFMTGQAFAVSSTTLMGQSLGKRRPDMAQAYCSRTRRIGMGCAIVVALVFIFFGRYIVALYNPMEEIVETGARILLIVAVLQTAPDLPVHHRGRPARRRRYPRDRGHHLYHRPAGPAGGGDRPHQLYLPRAVRRLDRDGLRPAAPVDAGAAPVPERQVEDHPA